LTFEQWKAKNCNTCGKKFTKCACNNVSLIDPEGPKTLSEWVASHSQPTVCCSEFINTGKHSHVPCNTCDQYKCICPPAACCEQLQTTGWCPHQNTSFQTCECDEYVQTGECGHIVTITTNTTDTSMWLGHTCCSFCGHDIHCDHTGPPHESFIEEI